LSLLSAANANMISCVSRDIAIRGVYARRGLFHPKNNSMHGVLSIMSMVWIAGDPCAEYNMPDNLIW
jgi:hypothetical protein